MAMPRERNEPVRLTRIYTGGGDRGETSLGDGTRVPKLDCRIAAFGAVDELNSLLGVVLAAEAPEELRAVLVRVQTSCSTWETTCSVPFGVTDRLRITHDQITALERDCGPLQRRPPGADELRVAGRVGAGGTPPRRARRVSPRRAGSARGGRGGARGINQLALVYLNRLSDLLFILARAANAGGEEPLWRPGSTS